jgi:hypothetical protein
VAYGEYSIRKKIAKNWRSMSDFASTSDIAHSCKPRTGGSLLREHESRLRKIHDAGHSDLWQYAARQKGNPNVHKF